MSVIQIVGWSVWEKDEGRIGPAFYDDHSKSACYLEKDTGSFGRFNKDLHVLIKDRVTG